MKKWYVFVVLFAFSCTKPGVKDTLHHLSGYWEIKNVVFPDGSKKQYTVNQTIDYIMLNADTTGYRKKVQPRLDGTFLTTDHVEYFTIVTAKNELQMQYETALDQWRETIIDIDKNQLVVRNKNNFIYIYERFQSIIPVKNAPKQ